MSAISTSAGLVYDHHSIQLGYTDQQITYHANLALKKHHYLMQHSNISVITYHREVLLAGQVVTPALRNEAVNIVRNIPNIRYIINDIQIGKPNSEQQYVNDAWITGKIDSKIILSGDYNPNSIYITTLNGNVYAFATLYKTQGEKLYKLIKNTYGVKRIVKIYNFIQTPT